MNRKIILCVALAILLSAVGGAAALIIENMTPSNFFQRFSLRVLVEKNDSPSGALCAKGGGGGGGAGIGGSSGGIGARVSTYGKSESFSCRIEPADADKFDEIEFISALKKDVERDLKQSDLKVTKSENPKPSGFSFEYEQGDLKGSVKIAGERQENYYVLNASLRERRDERAR